ncbi:MAG: FHA domain-containing protein, partial [Pyrinomonadaceae bacterium]|nr:FHA domain-containing protein [Pyrinomonadaceae bacterium]
TTSFSVELRVDGTLTESEVRVQHSWEESSSSNKTSIVARSSSQSPKSDSKSTQNQAQNYVPPPTQPFQAGETFNQFDSLQNQSDATSSQLAPTILGADVNNVISKQNDSNDGATRVSPRKGSGNLDSEATKVGKRPFYRIEIWRNNKRESVESIFKSEITIGRKSVKIPSDVQLDGDSEISRPHAVISRNDKGLFFITHKGKNPTLVNGQEIPLEQPVQIRLDDTVTICTFMLRVSA